MTNLVHHDPPAMHAELERARQRADHRNPACPNCGRRFAVAARRPGHQHLTFTCDPARPIGGCGKEWVAK